MAEIAYTLKRSKRAKHMRLTVYPDGVVVLTAPLRAEQSIIKKFFSEKTQWVLNHIQSFKGMDKKTIHTLSRRDYIKNKEKAFALVQDRVRFYSNVYDYSFNKIFIKNQKTCWGSCSAKRNLNFNYKLIALPQKQRDYIIVHEMCHLEELNHSKRFWALVAKTFPDYAELRKELRNHKFLYR